jgi:iron complex outermembrane recepter protein
VLLPPDFFPGFRIALDYFNLELTNAITSIGGGTQDIQKLCYASGGTSPYSALTIHPFPITNTMIFPRISGRG